MRSIRQILAKLFVSIASCISGLISSSNQNVLLYYDVINQLNKCMSYSQSILQLINIKISETQILRLTRPINRILNYFADIIDDLEFANPIGNQKEIDLGKINFLKQISESIQFSFCFFSSFQSSDIPEIYLKHINGKETPFLNIISNLRSSQDQLFKINHNKTAGAEFLHNSSSFISIIEDIKSITKSYPR
jgi:hypothetical protein